MAVDPKITLAIIEKELAIAKHLGRHQGWEFGSLDAARPTFLVKMKSPIDGEEYHVEFQLDDYREMPPFIEFIHPTTGERGTRRCYPKDQHPEGGSIFHDTPCICHPSSRKAYGKYRGPHADWDAQITNWPAQAKGLTTIAEILQMIQARISDRTSYKGRMEK